MVAPTNTELLLGLPSSKIAIPTAQMLGVGTVGCFKVYARDNHGVLRQSPLSRKPNARASDLIRVMSGEHFGEGIIANLRQFPAEAFPRVALLAGNPASRRRDGKAGGQGRRSAGSTSAVVQLIVQMT